MTKILIAEDHAIVREPLARLLRMEGYETLCASDGNQALAVLEAGPIDLVLLDLMMPRRGGVAFLEALRADPRHRNLPVIVLTSVIEGSTLDRARELGVMDVLPKARFTIEELLIHISHSLNASAAVHAGVA